MSGDQTDTERQPDWDWPMAAVRRRRLSWWWLLPVLALFLSVGFFWQTATIKPVQIDIRFRHGHGIKPDDALLYRGIRVGEVQRVRLGGELQQVHMTVGLLPEAAGLARTGSRFWIVRPQVDLSGVGGLETLLGANYLSVLPGHGPPQYTFVGLEDVPIVDTLEPGGLELVLQGERVRGLHAGAPVYFRQVTIGRIAAVNLASDASAVEISVYIRPQYAHLVRQDSRFWQIGGLNVSGGLGSFAIDLESLQSLFKGGISVATPSADSPQAVAGDRFVLHAEPNKDWLNWKPALLPQQGVVKPTQQLPEPVAVQLQWRETRYFFTTAQVEQTGKVWPLAAGLLGPARVLRAPTKANAGSVHLRITRDSGSEPQSMPAMPETAGDAPASSTTGAAEPATRAVQAPEVLWSDHGLALIEMVHPAAQALQQRAAATPEDVHLYALDGASSTFISAARLSSEGGHWRLAPSVALPGDFHGALAFAAADQALLGVLSHQDKEPAFIVPGPFPKP